MAKCNNCPKTITWDKIEHEKIGVWKPKDVILVNGIRKLVDHVCQSMPSIDDISVQERQALWDYVRTRPAYYCGQHLEKLCDLKEGYDLAQKQVCSQCGHSPSVIEVVTPQIEVIGSGKSER